LAAEEAYQVGAQVDQVDEPHTTFIFALEAYPEPKCLSSDDLNALYNKLKSYSEVGRLIGASEDFVRQNHKPHQLNPLLYKNKRKRD
jgi:hypothetical protein